MIRYGFNIRTKSGQRVDNIQIMAANRSDAERRLRQMYVQCEIIERRERSVPRRVDIRATSAVAGPVGAAPSLHKTGTH